ncbi:MAG TPA: T9SS type A sorting domain-containing protein [Chitinophagales bacterium]|nr:T9SS type A sorting domain-containing protein [Chitinophagales bacterium]
MKKSLHYLLLICISIIFSNHSAKAQCITSDTLNWDWQYFNPTALPTSGVNFMMGVTSMRLSWRAAASNTNNLISTNGAPNTTGVIAPRHTGEAASFGFGNDLQFNVSAGADTFVFADTVRNVKFSIYDIDQRQAVTITASGLSGSVPITTLAKTNAASTLTIAGSGTNTASATFPSTTNIANNSNLAAVNVTIAGPVQTVILTWTKNNTTPDSIFISDISANVVGCWPNGYQAVSTPEAGQHNYVLGTIGDSLIVIDLTNNTSNFLYEDASIFSPTTGTTAGNKRINSLAYDPYRQIVYYCDHDTSVGNANVKKVFKYDVKTGVKSTFINDITTLGVVLEGGRLGSAGACFYNGSLFLGVDANYAAQEASNVWRIDINSSGVATKASRMWGKQGTRTPFTGLRPYLYNFGDFVINNGIFYNFNQGTASGTNITSVQHISLDKQYATNSWADTTSSGAIIPFQASIDYNGNIYNMLMGSTQTYDKAGNFGAAVTYTGSYGAGSGLMDAAESFKYPYDFGDAPLGYGVAFHLYRTSPNLKIGSVVDFEVNDTIAPSAGGDDLVIPASGSVDDEEGVASFSTITVANASYAATVAVTNATGANATLYGYLDFNRDGDFSDAGERSSATTVLNGATSATVTWTGLTGGVVGASFVRLRIASSSVEASSAFGYAGSGEVEDYPIPIGASPLPVELTTFKGEAVDNSSTLLTWETASEKENDYFDVERSDDANNWEIIGQVKGHGTSNQVNAYKFVDEKPFSGVNYYRLNQVDYDGTSTYTSIISVAFSTIVNEEQGKITIFPNPTKNNIWISSEKELTKPLNIDVFNAFGEKIVGMLMTEKTQQIDLSNLQAGCYFIKIDNKIYKSIKY